MSEQLDLGEAFAAQADAIARAEEHAVPSWLDAARLVIWSLPSGAEFTTDDVWAGLCSTHRRGKPPPAPPAPAPSLGA